MLFAGAVDFTLTPEGDIDVVTVTRWRKIDIDVPSFLPAPIRNARADLGLTYFGATNRLVVDTEALVQGEKASLSGDISFVDGPEIGLMVNFDTLARETALIYGRSK